MKLDKTRVIISIVFTFIGVAILIFTMNPPEIFQYIDGSWKMATYFVGGFCVVASIYTLFYREEK